ncbi:hypothetical protein Bca52824_015750 [Brassica carinata]|uniref:DUF4283 domain-containing protein n=1 Tax=Brassica carinata TaxID=52824 RepID=A0A8X8B5V4_BRACI|nr:hypothetical protein Bca52824_015750 [Brassica carinata]
MSQPTNSLNATSTQRLDNEDDDLVILPDVDNSELIARHNLSLVGRLFNKERRSVEALIALLPRPNIWDVEGRARGVDLGNHRFHFDFDSEADLQKVLSKRPCHFNKWSFALERWTPHIGVSFPNKMTFWVSVTGIPTHYWLDPIFRALGKGLGLVGNVEAKAAKFELELDAELPLKFKLRAQLPSGEIVPVTLEYSNLHLWCHHCRLLSHEVESCPQLSDDQKEQFIKEKESSRVQGPFSRAEVNRNGETSKRAIVPESKAPLKQERRLGDHSQRDNRDSVWKRIDSRYAPREDYRRDYRQAPRESEKLPPLKDSYNKRRYEESFASSRQREEERKTTSKLSSPRKGSEKGHLPSASRSQQAARTLNQPEPVTEKPHREGISSSSPEHVRERPFKLTLHKRSTEDHKLKGIVSDLETESDGGSSAKKSLKFDKDNWYEQTMEEEEENLNQATVNSPDLPKSKAMETVGDPDAEKILEDEDWMANEVNYDDDDLMDEEEDDLLFEDMEQEGASIVPAGTDPKSLMNEDLSVLEGKNKILEKTSPPARANLRSDSRPAQTPSSKSRPSPAKKKRGTPSPIAPGVSLRQRNLMVGRTLSKTRASKSGLNAQHGLSQAHESVPSDIKEAELFLKNIKKSGKVGRNKPPKIPG